MEQDNLLTDPILGLQTPTGLEPTDLPGLLAALGDDRALSLPGLQRHQEDAFHIFLCYLAAAVLARQGARNPAQETDYWRDGIRGLTREAGCPHDSAWALVTSDPTQPAFMQPPVSRLEEFSGFSPKAETPDALDLLPTAKNHDVKSNRSADGRREDWVFALVSLQTMSGFFGAGNYGIARMNGGFGSRPVVTLVPAGTWGRRWRSDVSRLLEIREELLGGAWAYQARGLVLTWVPAWDRISSLPLRSLDPFFVEVCRAVRLVRSEKGVRAYAAPSQAPRIAAREALGALGDPWIPVKLDGKNGPQALTVGPAGLSAELLRNLLFFEDGGYRPAAMQRPSAGLTEGPVRFSVTVFVRGQGTTDGFQHEEIAIPAQVRTLLFGTGPEREALAARSRRALENAGLLESRVLKPAVLSFLQGAGGNQTIDWDQRQINTWWQRAARAFRASWSAELFPWLWRTAGEAGDEEADRAWLLFIRDSAQAALYTVVREYPHRQGRRFRSRAVAEDIFIGSLYKHFPQLKEGSRGAARD
jgi:CRISPR system Cascade subunit CasA